MENLPAELVDSIFTFLALEDLRACACTCRRLRDIACNPAQYRTRAVAISPLIASVDELVGHVARLGPALRLVIDHPSLSDEMVAALNLEPFAELQLDSCARLSDTALAELLARSPHLRALRAWRPRLAVSDALIHSLADQLICPPLHSLELSGASTKLTDAGLVRLSTCEALMGSLRTVGLRGCRGLRDAGIAALLGRSSITALDVSLTLVTAGAFAGVVRAAPSPLRSLNLAVARAIGDEAIESLVRLCPALTEINLSQLSISVRAVEALASSLSSLAVLRMDYCSHLTSIAVPAPGSTNPAVLRSLSLLSVRQLPPDGLLALLDAQPHLTELRVGHMLACDTVLARLAAARRLERLQLGSPDAASISDAGVRALLASCAHCLVEISVQGGSRSALTTAIFAAELPPMPRLAVLSFAGLRASRTSWRDGLDVVRLLGAMPALHALELSGAFALTIAKGATCDSDHNGLETLTLRRCAGVDDALLKALLPRLGPVRSVHLDLAGGVHDAGVIELLVTCNYRLNALSLVETSVSDALLVPLCAARRLSYLNLGGTAVSDAGWEAALTSVREPLPLLAVLDLIHCRGIAGPSTLALLSRHCRLLRELKLDGTPLAAERAIEDLTTLFPSMISAQPSVWM